MKKITLTIKVQEGRFKATEELVRYLLDQAFFESNSRAFGETFTIYSLDVDTIEELSNLEIPF